MINFYRHKSVKCRYLALIFQCLLIIFSCPSIILSMWIVDPPITASLGSSVALPCNITPPTTDDALLLLLFYRNESNQPLYTLDSRNTNILSNATFYYAQENFSSQSKPIVNETSLRRYEFQLKKPISFMFIKNLNGSDAGDYRCRVDFRHSRTINRLMRLQITEPISSIQIFDSNGQSLKQIAGPFNEDAQMNFTCVAIGGNPPAKIRWILGKNKFNLRNQKNNQLDLKLIDLNLFKKINGSMNNTLNIILTRAFYGQQLTCEAQNESNKLQHTIIIDLNLKPDKIEIQTDENGILIAGKKSKFLCYTIGGSKTIASWWKSEIKEDRLIKLNKTIQDDFFIKLSDNELLDFIPTPEDHGKILKCKIQMTTLSTFQMVKILTIQVQFKPIVSLVMGASANNQQLLEGTDLFFECNVQANPYVNTVTWLFNKSLLFSESIEKNYLKNQLNSSNISLSQKKSKELIKQNKINLIKHSNNSLQRIDFYKQNQLLMKINSADRQHNGIYECVVTNQLGETHSEPVLLDIKYTPTCTTDHVYYTLNEKHIDTKNITLNCPLVAGNPPEMNICWFFVNHSTVEYCYNKNINDFTLKEFLYSSFTLSNNDEDNNALLTEEKFTTVTNSNPFVNTILNQLNNGEEFQLLCWAVNIAGTQRKPCTIHLAKTTQPAQLVDCQIHNTTSHSLNVKCQTSVENIWRIENPVIHHLEVYDDQADILLYQLINTERPNFELNQLPAGSSIRLTVYSKNKKGTSNKLILRTSTLIPSKWRAADQQKNPFLFIKSALSIALTAFFLCLLFALLLLLNKIRNRRLIKHPLPEENFNNMVKLEQINFGLDSALSDSTTVQQAQSNSGLQCIENENNALDSIQLLAHDDICSVINNESIMMHFGTNDYASFGKVDSNVELVNAICLHYTPATTLNYCQSEIEQCPIQNFTSPLSTNCICRHCTIIDE